MSRAILLLPLAAVPVAPTLHYVPGVAPIWIFLTGIVGVGVLADRIRAATEQLARHTGPAVGGLLTISLGCLAELLLALFVFARGEQEVVRAQITGSIIGTSLLGLGLAIVAGGIARERQSFKRERAGLLSSLLMLAVIALLLPAVFDLTSRTVTHAPGLTVSEDALSLVVSGVLLLLYAGNLVFTLVTHRDVFSSGEEDGDGPAWPLWLCLIVLAAATTGAALESDLISGTLSAPATTLHLSPTFMGVIVLALVGTVADLFAAVWFARQDRMGLVMSICVGSAIQVALVVAPLLVIRSWLIGTPMTLVFTDPLDLFAIAGTAFIVNAITTDGETTWFEGVLLCALASFFVQLWISIREANRVFAGDPWDGRGLEWSTSAPPPEYNFAVIPQVQGRDAFFDAKREDNSDAPPVSYHDIELPKNSVVGPVLGAIGAATAFGLVWHMWWLAIIGVLAIVATVIARSFARDVHRIIPADEVERTERRWLRAVAEATPIPREVELRSANQGLAEVSA